MLTNKQKMLLHIVPTHLGVDDDQRRTIQRNIGGFESAADKSASHEGFVAVMAFYEDRGGGCLAGYTDGFWTQANEKNVNSGGGNDDRLRWLIRQQAASMSWEENECDIFMASKHCSSGAYQTIGEANRYWLSRCLDGMRAIAGRQ